MIEQLIHRIKVRQAELQVSLAIGTPVTWDAYQRIVGEYQGLNSVLNIIDNMLEEEAGN
mgnify:CR=1|jgi:hypothetical protein